MNVIGTLVFIGLALTACVSAFQPLLGSRASFGVRTKWRRETAIFAISSGPNDPPPVQKRRRRTKRKIDQENASEPATTSLEMEIRDVKELVADTSSTTAGADNDGTREVRSMAIEAEAGNLRSAVRGVVSKLMTANFFFVIVLLFWFIAGAISTYVLDNKFLQMSFLDAWDSVVQPALGGLMLGSLLLGLLGDKEAVEESA